MSDQFWQSLPTLVLALATFIVTVRTNRNVGRVHKQINSRMDQLLNITAITSKAEGIKEESERLK